MNLSTTSEIESECESGRAVRPSTPRVPPWGRPGIAIESGASPMRIRERTGWGAALVCVAGLLVPSPSGGAVGGPKKRVDSAHDVEPWIKARGASCRAAGRYKGSFWLDPDGPLLKTESVDPGKTD